MVLAAIVLRAAVFVRWWDNLIKHRIEEINSAKTKDYGVGVKEFLMPKIKQIFLDLYLSGTEIRLV